MTYCYVSLAEFDVFECIGLSEWEYLRSAIMIGYPEQSEAAPYYCIRLSTLSFFRNLPADAWPRSGIASDNPFTVRALAYIIAGHVGHHMAVIRERYL